MSFFPVPACDSCRTPSTNSDPSRTGQVLPYGEHGLRSLLAAAEGDVEGDLVDAVVGRSPER